MDIHIRQILALSLKISICSYVIEYVQQQYPDHVDLLDLRLSSSSSWWCPPPYFHRRSFLPLAPLPGSLGLVLYLCFLGLSLSHALFSSASSLFIRLILSIHFARLFILYFSHFSFWCKTTTSAAFPLHLSKIYSNLRMFSGYVWNQYYLLWVTQN